jgi:hypothetical protein
MNSVAEEGGGSGTASGSGSGGIDGGTGAGAPAAAPGAALAPATATATAATAMDGGSASGAVEGTTAKTSSIPETASPLPPDVVAAVAALTYTKPVRATTTAVLTAARLEAVRQRAEEQSIEEAVPLLNELAVLQRRLERGRAATQRLDANVRDRESLANLVPKLAADLSTLRKQEELLRTEAAARKAAAERLEAAATAESEVSRTATAELEQLESELAEATQRRDQLADDTQSRLKAINTAMAELQTSANNDMVIQTARLRSVQAQVQSSTEQVRILEKENDEFSTLCEQLLTALEGISGIDAGSDAPPPS